MAIRLRLIYPLLVFSLILSCGLPDNKFIERLTTENGKAEPINHSEEISFTINYPDRIEILGVNIFYKIYNDYYDDNTSLDNDKEAIDSSYVTGPIFLTQSGFTQAYSLEETANESYTVDVKKLSNTPLDISTISINPNDQNQIIIELSNGNSFELGRKINTAGDFEGFSIYNFDLNNPQLCDLDLLNLRNQLSESGQSTSVISISFAAYVIGMDPGNLGSSIESVPTYLGTWNYIDFLE